MRRAKRATRSSIVEQLTTVSKQNLKDGKVQPFNAAGALLGKFAFSSEFFYYKKLVGRRSTAGLVPRLTWL